MIESYFFIPTDKIEFINKLPELKADYFILDFEDSIKSTSLDLAFENIKKLNNIEKFWVRPFLFNQNGEFDLRLIIELIETGYRRFILPKIFDVSHLNEIANIKGSHLCEFILLIESAKAFVNIEKLLSYKSLRIIGVTLGSHDFVNDLGMRYNIGDLKHYRQNILLYARAYNLKPIDIASMDIKNIDSFKGEVLSGFNMGYRAKMFLHPVQLETIQEIEFFAKEEVSFAKEVLKEFPNISHEMGAIKFKGRILEKPHIKRIIEIVNFKKYETK